MNKLHAFVVALMLAGCYRDTPPCRPGTVDYPRCQDPTQPPFGRDRGAGGAPGHRGAARP